MIQKLFTTFLFFLMDLDREFRKQVQETQTKNAITKSVLATMTAKSAINNQTEKVQ